jgi:MFS family permease
MLNKSVIIRTTIIISLATIFQWYNFFIAAVAASTVWPFVFFPESSSGFILSIVAYAVTFVTRPIGGFFLGLIGDIFGRKNSNTFALFLMALGSFGIALTPSYATIEMLAFTLLIIFRTLQGVAIGGQWGGAVALVAELTATSKHKTFWTSLVQAALPLGMALAIFSTILLLKISLTFFISIGWRFLFILGGIFVILNSIIIRNVSESPLLLKKKRNQNINLFQNISYLAQYRKELLKLVFAEVYEVGTVSILIFPFSVSFLSILHIDVSNALMSVGIATLFASITIVLIGILASRMGKKRLFLLLSTGLSAIMLSYPYPILLSSKSFVLIIIAQTLLFSLLEIGYAVQGSFFAEHFPTEFRNTGINLSYHFSAAIAGSFNIIAISMLVPFLHSFINALIYITIIAMLLCITSFFTILVLLKETKDLSP